MKYVLFLNHCDPYLPEILAQNDFDCEFDVSSDYETVLQRIERYDGIVLRSRLPIDARLLRAATRLKFVARLGVGIEHIDRGVAEELGVQILNSPEGSRDAVAEHTIGLLLGLLRFIPRAGAEIARGVWDRKRNTGREIKGKTVGIMGYGNMGSALAEKLRGFGCRVIAYDRYKTDFTDEWTEEVDLPTLWRETQILSLHFPISEGNRHFVDGVFLRKFQHPLWLINTARGEILETAAVVEALRENRVVGAALDVLEYEEQSFANFSFDALPEDFRYLVASDRVLLTPHLAGITHEAMINHAHVLAEKILRNFAP